MFAELTPSRRQGRHPEKQPGWGRERGPDPGPRESPSAGPGWKQMFCGASTDAAFLLRSCAGTEMPGANWGCFSWDFYGFGEVKSVKKSLEPHQ